MPQSVTHFSFIDHCPCPKAWPIFLSLFIAPAPKRDPFLFRCALPLPQSVTHCLLFLLSAWLETLCVHFRLMLCTSGSSLVHTKINIAAFSDTTGGYRWPCSVRARPRLLSNQSVRYNNINLLVLTVPPIMLDQGRKWVCSLAENVSPCVRSISTREVFSVIRVDDQKPS